MLNNETETSLKAVLNRIEGFPNVNQVQLVLYMLVCTCILYPIIMTTFLL